MIAACIPVLRVLVRDVSRAGTSRYGRSTSPSRGGGHSSNHTYGSAVRRPVMTPNTGSGSSHGGGFGGARSLPSQASSCRGGRAQAPLEVMRQKTVVVEYSCARRDSGSWILDPVNLSPRTLFDEQLTKSLGDDASDLSDPRRSPVKALL